MRVWISWSRIHLLLMGPMLIALGGCHAGGNPTAELSPPATPVPFVTSPSVGSPAANPFYSNANSVTITGLCQQGFIVSITGAAIASQKCVNSAYSFTVNKTVDGVYSFLIEQQDENQSSSVPYNFVWVRKSSVAPPTVTSPAATPFRSAQSTLALSGTCESGATVSMSGDGVGTTTCTNSLFNLSLPKGSDGDYNLIITQTDGAGNSASILFVWQKHNLTVTPTNPSLIVKTSQALSLSGGSGVYSATLTNNNSGATYNSATNTYIAGTLSGVIDTITVQDSLGATSQVLVNVVHGVADHLSLPADSGNSQVGVAGLLLPQHLKVQVVDRYGNGVPTYPVLFRSVAGDGVLQGVTVQVSNLNGYAEVPLRLGYSSIANSVRVSALGTTLPDLALSGAAVVDFIETTTTSGTGKLGATFTTGPSPGVSVSGDFNGDGIVDVVVLNTAEPSLGVLLGQGSGMFGAMTKIRPICAGPNAMVAADFNGDGKLDIAIACSGSDTVSVYLGKGDGTFQPAISFSTDPNETLPSQLAVADIDKDGKLDLIVSASGSGLIGVWRGTGDGHFLAPTEYTVGLGPGALAVTDLNKDGWPDVVVLNNADNSFSVLLNTGTGALGAPTTSPCGLNPVSLAVADLDGDGNKDLAIVSQDDSTLGVYLGDDHGAFNPALNTTLGGGASSLAVLDLNGDNKLDVVVTNSADDTLSVLIGQGNGLFSPEPAFTVERNPVYVMAADLNGDGRKDLLVSTDGNNLLQLVPLQQDGTLGFFSTAGSNPSSVSSGDLNGDGKIDLVVANAGTNDVTVLQGLGNGLFATGATLPAGIMPSAVLVVDLNADGHPDIVIVNQTSATVRVYLNDGTGAFGVPTDFSVGLGPVAIVAKDFNGDGNLDLAVANSTASTVSLLFGDGHGSFQPKVDYHVGSAPVSIVAADFNGDNLVDLAVANNSSNNVSVLIANDDGTFQASVEYPCGGNPTGLIAADLNSDGKIDIATANSQDGTVSILLGNGDGSLKTNVDYFAGPTPVGIVVGDFNGDSRLDLAITDGNDSSFTLLPGTGNGLFNTTTNIPTKSALKGLSVSDVNSDGALDLLLIESAKIETWVGH